MGLSVALALGVPLVVVVTDTLGVGLGVGLVVGLGVGGGESDAPHAVQLDNRNAPPIGLHVEPVGHGMIDVALGQ